MGLFFQEADAFHVPLDVEGIPFTLPDGTGFMSNHYTPANSWPGHYGYTNEDINHLVKKGCTEFNQNK